MNEELTPLEALDMLFYIASKFNDSCLIESLKKEHNEELINYYKLIETALIENDEAQRELTNLKKAILKGDITNKWVTDCVNQKNKKLKALEIIKEKVVCYFNDKALAITMYRNSPNQMLFIPLFFDSKEEYDLLKEVLL